MNFEENKFGRMKTFVLGFMLAVILFAGYSVVTRWDALVTAWAYPEVVSTLKFDKQYSLKK